MLNKIAVNITQPLDPSGGERLRKSLLALPGVKQVNFARSGRVEVYYDGTEARAGSLMTVIRAHGLRTGFNK
ncbi:MAG: hypothetical protein M0Z41_18035 [Peptococcaceae bacterium]|jgi:hypothetical protein|nr:hypothetical protein [Peptococcaceae bacterium]